MICISFLSYLGIAFGFQRWGKLPQNLTFLIAASFIIIYGFIAGVLNVLPYAVIFLHALGIVSLFGILAEAISKRTINDYFTLPPLILFFVVVVSTFFIFDYRLTGWDEFSHWGLVLKT